MRMKCSWIPIGFQISQRLVAKAKHRKRSEYVLIRVYVRLNFRLWKKRIRGAQIRE